MQDVWMAFRKTRFFLPATAAILIVLFYLSINYVVWKPLTATSFHRLDNKKFTKWPEYDASMLHDKDWYSETCWQSEDLSLDTLHLVMKKWSASTLPDCKILYEILRDIYTVTVREGEMKIPESMKPKVLRWMGNNKESLKEFDHQEITFIFNEFSHEHIMYNVMRSRRPIAEQETTGRKYVDDLALEAAESCDFCNYKKYTAEDLFGHLVSERSFTAANSFKYDAWHTLIIPKTHHPLNWSREDFMDMMTLSMKWFNKVYEYDHSYHLPILLWDLLPRAGASQIHPHAHLSMDPDRYYGVMENIRLAAQHYNDHHRDGNYFSHVAQVHSALGLTVTIGAATALVHLTPRKDNEVVIFSKEADKDFFELIYQILRAFIDDMDMLCFSMGIAFPDMNSSAEGRIPAFVRVVPRGDVSSIKTDITSLELFGASNINVDPFTFAKKLQSLNNRKFATTS